MNRLKVGDLVQVIAGKNKGKRGKVTSFTKDNRVFVEGLNMVVRHTRPTQQNPEGGRLTKEAPLASSNVMPIDAETDKPTRVKLTVNDEGQKARTSTVGNALKQG